MKQKIYNLTLVILLLSTLTFAQEKLMKRPDQDKMKAFKIAYITDKLDLSPEEAQKFWPIYNKHEIIMTELRQQEGLTIKKYIKERSDIENISELEAKEAVIEINKIHIQIENQRGKIFNKLKTVLPYKKILKLQIAEKEFKRSLLRKLKRRKKEFKGEKN